jgi:hypothetical protein
MPNPYEEEARMRKASKLITLFTQCTHSTPDEIRYLDEAGWAAASQLAGVNLPSSTTRELVIEMMEQSNTLVDRINRETSS